MKKTVITVVSIVVLTILIGFFIWSYHRTSNDHMQPEVDHMQLFGRDVTKEVSLVEALYAFNKKYSDEAPLTEQEVVKAIQNWNREEHPVSDSVYALYRRVAEEHILPKGMYFSKITKYLDGDYAYEVDWKDLALTSLPVGQKDADIGFGYNYRIRARYISKRSLTDEEKKELLEQKLR